MSKDIPKIYTRLMAGELVPIKEFQLGMKKDYNDTIPEDFATLVQIYKNLLDIKVAEMKAELDKLLMERQLKDIIGSAR